MKNLLCFILGVSLASCSAQYHINKADKHEQKAIKKGAVITGDTTVVTHTDTITKIYTRGDTVFIDNTILKTDTVYIEGEIRYITRKDKRQEKRRERRADRRNHKIRKIAVRQEGKTERAKHRSLWWLWFALGALAMFLVRIGLKYVNLHYGKN